MEPLQYFTGHNSRLKGSSAEKIYEELDLESFIPRHWYRKMRFLYKVLKSESPSHLFNTIPNCNAQRQTKNSGNIISFFVKHDYFKSFFPSATTKWNKLVCYMSKADSF